MWAFEAKLKQYSQKSQIVYYMIPNSFGRLENNEKKVCQLLEAYNLTVNKLYIPVVLSVTHSFTATCFSM